MAKYTVTLIEFKNEFDLEVSDLFPDSYDFYDNGHRADFEQKFYDTYFDREIGFETYSIFKHKLKAKLNNIMPYYKMLYETEKMVIDPLSEFEYTETYNRDVLGKYNDKTDISDEVETTNTHKTSSKSKGVNKTDGENILSDTPQGYIDTGKLNHASEVSKDKSSGTTSADSSSDGENKQHGKSKSNTLGERDKDEKEVFKRNIKGRKNKSEMEMLNEYRNLWANIDKMIIDECEVLFMGVF